MEAEEEEEEDGRLPGTDRGRTQGVWREGGEVDEEADAAAEADEEAACCLLVDGVWPIGFVLALGLAFVGVVVLRGVGRTLATPELFALFTLAV